MQKQVGAVLAAGLLLLTLQTGVLAEPDASASTASLRASVQEQPAAEPQAASSATQADVVAPSIPSLYSQAAVLIDADSGQVLGGKNANARMYPASITKIMTLLLAIELGNPNDLITMTDEAVWSVPRYATHIALTPDEQLTLEQLELAMMVESANDAANGIATYLGGSLDGFAAMMNRRAAELGALRTQFVNANGLPDPNHYTTAYDMALITKAAYAHPEFRRLAGTERYEIPPTNKQAETRRLSNRQYMFTQNDTYPGAFAGKTGWTEEAGKTLVTLAERDGVTLICVVMKPSGTVDGEFKDSTALLDYGFDQFQKTVIPPERIPVKKDQNGSWQADGELTVLLPRGVRMEDLTFSVEADGMLLVDLPQNYAGPSGTRLIEQPLRYQPHSVPVEPVDTQIETEHAAWRIAKICLKWAGILVGGALLLLLLVRLVVRGYFWLCRMLEQAKRRWIEARIRHQERELEEGRRLLMLQRAKQRRKRQHKEQRMAQRQQRRSQPQPQPTPDVIDVTMDKAKKHKITIIDEREL